MFHLVMGDALGRNAAKYPAKTAVKDLSRSLTYGDLNDHANSLANALLSEGIEVGDPVALLVGNRVEHIEILFALAKIGALAIPLDKKWRALEMASTLSHLQPKALFLEDESRAEYEEAKRLKPLDSIDKAVTVDDAEYATLTNTPHIEDPPVTIRETDDFIVMITSGTTGFPKGCLTDHRTYVLICINNAIEKGLGPHDTALLSSPLYFSHGRNFSLTTLYFGGMLILHDQFHPVCFLETIQKNKVTYIGAVPTMCERLVQVAEVGNYDTSSLRCLSITGGKVHAATLEKLQAHITPHIYRTYAATDCGQMAISKPADLAYKPSSAGRPVWCADLRVVDDAGQFVPVNQVGEIICKSPLATQGYYRNPEATASSFLDGWFHTGDLGYFDEEGFLYVVGRKKDMIKSGGISVYPEEIESVFHLHEDVLEAAVIGIPDAYWGECTKAVVVLKSGVTKPSPDLLLFCKERLAAYKVPKSIDIVTEIPHTQLGKVSKEKLREMYAASA